MLSSIIDRQALNEEKGKIINEANQIKQDGFYSPTDKANTEGRLKVIDDQLKDIEFKRINNIITEEEYVKLNVKSLKKKRAELLVKKCENILIITQINLTALKLIHLKPEKKLNSFSKGNLVKTLILAVILNMLDMVNY